MSELLRILSEWNSWWETGSVSSELTGNKRGYTHELTSLKDVDDKQIYEIMQTRVGDFKTFLNHVSSFLDLGNKKIYQIE